MDMQRGHKISIFRDIHNMTELGLEQPPGQQLRLGDLQMFLPTYMIL